MLGSGSVNGALPRVCYMIRCDTTGAVGRWRAISTIFSTFTPCACSQQLLKSLNSISGGGSVYDDVYGENILPRLRIKNLMKTGKFLESDETIIGM